MPPSDPRSLLVVGAGLAGWRTAKETRKAGFDGTITVLSDEDEIPYDRPPLSKQVLTREREPAFALLTDDDEIGSLDIDLRRGEADAVRGVHGLQHVVDQFTQWGVHGGHRGRPGAQPGVRILQDCEARHGSKAVGAYN